MADKLTEATKRLGEDMALFDAGKPVEKEILTVELTGKNAVAYRFICAAVTKDTATQVIVQEGIAAVLKSFGGVLFK